MNETFRSLVDALDHLLTSLTEDEYNILYETYCKLYHSIYPKDNDWKDAFDSVFCTAHEAKEVVDKWREENGMIKLCGASIEPMKDKGTGTAASDPVNHPSHYTWSSIEPIDTIEAWQLPYHLGNVVKYVSRAGHKDKSKTLEDLKKANWYLSRYINNLEQEEA